MTHPTDTAKSDELRDMFEAGFIACWSEMFVKSDEKPAFELNDAALERAWEIYLSTHPVSSPPQNDAGGEVMPYELALRKAKSAEEWFYRAAYAEKAIIEVRERLQKIATGSIVGEKANYRDTVAIMREIAKEAIDGLNYTRTPMSELQALGQEFEAGEAVTSDSADYLHTFYGILNAQGKFWTPLPFNCEESARRHLAKVATGENKSILTTHKIVPVRIRLSALPSTPSGEG